MTAPRSSTGTLIAAMMILSRHVQTDDGVFNAALAETAQRLGELREIVIAALPMVQAQEWREGFAAKKTGTINLVERMKAEADAC